MRLTSLEYEQSLRVDLRIRLSVHRAFCTWCARYAHQLKLLHDACQSTSTSEEQGDREEGAARSELNGRYRGRRLSRTVLESSSRV